MSIDTIVGLVALPRSGTTMLSAVFDAHPDVVALYEPWNSDAEDKIAQEKSFTEERTIGRLFDECLRIKTSARVLIIKETATQPEYITNLFELLDGAGPDTNCQTVILLRNPLHCFLSEVEARRRWWGVPSSAVTAEFFLQWASSRLPVLGEMAMSIKLRGGKVIFYDTLVAHPQASFGRIMREFGLPFYPSQILISQNANLDRARGDISLTENPRNVESVSVDKRRIEFERHRDVFVGLACYNKILGIVEQFEMYGSHLILTPSMPEYDTFFLTFEERIALAQEAIEEDLSRTASRSPPSMNPRSG